MYKDSWENVLGNCDSLLFLGGQEPTTLEHVSKMLGKETIDTRSRNRTKGRQGSTSENDGILGRELMTVDELKVMKDNECILFVRGIYPFFCDKYKIEKHPNYVLLEDSAKVSLITHEISSYAIELDGKDETEFWNDEAFDASLVSEDGVILGTFHEEPPGGSVGGEVTVSKGYQVVYDCTDDKIMLLYVVSTESTDGMTTYYRVETEEFEDFSLYGFIVSVAMQTCMNLV